MGKLSFEIDGRSTAVEVGPEMVRSVVRELVHSRRFALRDLGLKLRTGLGISTAMCDRVLGEGL
jgi:hypothetical protein